MLTTAELKSLLTTHHLRLTKRLGQHHLIDARVIRRIVEACALSQSDTVVEIGAGLGALTESLAQQAGRVLAVERDRGICALLAERMAPLAHVSVECRDILTYSPQQLDGAVVVGAIPYHITSQILVWLSDARRATRKAVIVVQQEVAKRLVARPGTDAYGRLSVLAQYGWDVRLLFSISRSAFFPQPAVDSSCLELLPRRLAPVRVPDERAFFEIVKAAFSQRRKTLMNCLSGLTVTNGGGRRLPVVRADVASALKEMQLREAVRGERLSLEQFAELTDWLLRIRK